MYCYYYYYYYYYYSNSDFEFDSMRKFDSTRSNYLNHITESEIYRNWKSTYQIFCFIIATSICRIIDLSNYLFVKPHIYRVIYLSNHLFIYMKVNKHEIIWNTLSRMSIIKSNVKTIQCVTIICLFITLKKLTLTKKHTRSKFWRI